MTKHLLGLTLICWIAQASCIHAVHAQSSAPAPVLVELFTSEGCSSCPPADALLQLLDRSQPVPGAEIIVLSEHVDYWNHIGWRDPYSSKMVSARQNDYSRALGIDSVYTPQMIVDGSSQFVGNNRDFARQAIQEATLRPKIPLRLSDIHWQGPITFHAHVDVGPMPNSGSSSADIFLVAALDHAESQVLRGENEGRHLTHVAVVLRLVKVGTTKPGNSFSQDVQMDLDARSDLRNLRVVAFVQGKNSGKVLGAAEQHLSR